MEVLAQARKRIAAEGSVNVFWRAVSFLISSIYFANLPVILFLVYMHEHRFFSYDFFEKGVFGMKVFFLLFVVMILITSLGLFAFVIPLIGWKAKKRLDVGDLIGALLVSLFMWVVAIATYISAESVNLERLGYVSTVSLLVAFHVGVLLYCKPRTQFISWLLFATLSLVLTFKMEAAVANVVGTALNGFGSGGNICVVVNANGQEMRGTALMVSPEYIYFRQGGGSSIAVLKREGGVHFSTESDACQRQTGTGSEESQNKQGAPGAPGSGLGAAGSGLAL